MSFSSLLNDSCIIKNRTVTHGKTDTESWQAQAPIKCRVLKRERYTASGEKVQHATRVRTIVVLPKSAKLSVRDRIEHESRVYEVIEIAKSRDARKIHHLNAVCDTVV